MVKYCNIRRRRHNTRSTTTGGSEEDLIVVIAGGGEENLKGWKREDQRRFFTRSLPWPMRLSRGGGRRWGCRSDRSWMYVHRTRDLCDIWGAGSNRAPAQRTDEVRFTSVWRWRTFHRRGSACETHGASDDSRKPVPSDVRRARRDCRPPRGNAFSQISYNDRTTTAPRCG